MPIHQPFSRLPVWLRRVLTLLAVVVLAALLTHWRQNASTYATGFWDTGSQPLVFGRMLQIENHQSAPGGFMGVYTQEWSDGQNRTWFRENAPVRADDFQSYTHQSGLQGWAFGQLNRVFRLVQPSGEVRETWLYTTNCILFYTAELLLAVAVWQQAGPVAALVWVLAAVFAPWPQRGMKDLYWCLWTWLLPVLASLLLCRVTARKGRTPGWCFALVALAVLVRCMCGFEFISTFLILCEIPLCCALVQTLCVDRDPQVARRWLGRTVGTGAAALGGMAAALGLWLWQEVQYFGTAAEALASMTQAVTSRVSVSDDAVRAVIIPEVLHLYFAENQEPLLQFGPVTVTLLPLLAVVLAEAAVCAVLLARRRQLAKLAPLATAWVLSLAAPVSWMVLSKAHAAIHTHLVPMLWHFALVPVSCLALVVMTKEIAALLFRRKPDLVASH